MRPVPESDLHGDLRAALMLLTRLPVRGTPTEPAARSAWAWPLVGAMVGAAGGGAMAGAAALGLAPGFAAALGLAAMIALTGALHEDGLADVADGVWGGRDPERRLAIMRDSRVGAYGVIALALALLMRWSLLLAALDTAPVLAPLAAAAASRAALPVLMRGPPARPDGLSRHAGRPGGAATLVALLLGAAPLTLFGADGLLAALLAAAALWGLARLARAKIGGQTGDVLGAGQQVAEVAVLAMLVRG